MLSFNPGNFKIHLIANYSPDILGYNESAEKESQMVFLDTVKCHVYSLETKMGSFFQYEQTKHLLWAIEFLKCYTNEFKCIITSFRSESFCRKMCWVFVKLVSSSDYADAFQIKCEFSLKVITINQEL